ncbi:expressed unknown protein [Seminavis robusta]|uniref:Uncharacterized protein n=1 Tax=Seminavis robusta TaxID=568900 RepID=A0A9N8DCP5_9STRA|nr:expressed unknown protein [Seminavis robusta]|eukprot:Sro17_g012350.1 n/a (302) ;mRNA; f:83737-84854
MDDDEFIPHHDYYARPQQQRHRRPLGVARDYGRAKGTDASSYLNRQYFGILMALFVIYIFHRVGFGRGISERGIMDCLLEVQDYALAYGQMALEFCRKLRCYLLAGGEDWFLHDMPISPNASAALHPNGLRGRRRNMAAPVASRIASSRMPELEETDINPLQQLDPLPAAAINNNNKENTDPLEPAFLNDEDYPPGWLVFDPVLGVVSKAEADNYKRKQQNAQKSPKQKPRQLRVSQQQQQQQPVANSPTARRNTKQNMQQQPSQQFKSNSTKTPTRPLRTNNVMPSASAMHTPQTIAANG